MPLSAPVPRTHQHNRDLLFRGYRRDDGLWPDPVWGRPGATPWPGGVRTRLLETV